jgi:endoglucanase
MKKHILISLAIILAGIPLLAIYTNTNAATNTPANQFVHSQGNQLVANDEIIKLRGINFNNYHWYHTGEDIITSNHHSSEDYTKVKEMGMNVVRFQMNYKVFEDDANPWVYKESGFAWLDENIAWAKEHDIYLILDMHVPPGGAQSGLPEGINLWQDHQNQYRLGGLWHEIAQRYHDEPTIAGFSLLNEPVPVSHIDEWNALAQYIVDRIRTIDENHMIVFEWPLGLYEQFDTYNDRELVQSLLDDDNVLYDMHFYHPFEFTHQNLSWMGTSDGGVYPDNTRISFPDDLRWSDATFSNPTTPEGYSYWNYYKGELIKNTNQNHVLAVPTLVSGSQIGSVFFKNIIITEYNQNKEFIREIDVSLHIDSGWETWNSTGDAIFNSVIKNEENVLSIKQTPSQSMWYSVDQYIEVKKDHYYSISGEMKGKRIEEYGYGQIRLDFYTSPSQTQITQRDKDNIEHTLLYWTQFATDNNVPLFIGEFGTNNSTFIDDKGGMTWVKDVIDLFEKHNLHYTYHDYHSHDAFGLYSNALGLPDEHNANNELIDFFTEFFNFSF